MKPGERPGDDAGTHADRGSGCPTGRPVPAPDLCAGVDCPSVRLTDLTEGERGQVTCLEQPGGPHAARLAALGVLPGVEIELVQRSPVFVFRLGYAEFAVDAALADRIRVERAALDAAAEPR